MARDASRSSKEGRDVLVHGYHGCMAVACQSGRRKTVPLALRLWFSRAPGHLGENDEVIKLITTIMVVVRGFGDDTMMPLTSLPANGSFESMWRIVKGYLTRWRIEETIRFVKQAYGFENELLEFLPGFRELFAADLC